MFDLRKRLVGDFREYIESFLKVSDAGIREFLSRELDNGALWPEPLLQLNPTFDKAQLVDELIQAGTLDSRCGTIFRRGKSAADPAGRPLSLFRHQIDAIERAQSGSSYILTTGTGSGKSLSYILPIVDAILKEGSGKGIRAIVVYPMNALANSQLGELEKFLGRPDEDPAVTYALFTGPLKEAERDRVRQSPPDILLTNFMMLELILTRAFDDKLVEAMSNLRFVVLDELHTYRGRQGADVALLMRRLAERSGSKRIQYIGTSATLSTEGTPAGKRRAVAQVGTRLFGSPVSENDIIGETLRRFSDDLDTDDPAFVDRLKAAVAEPLPTTPARFKSHPLTVWLESTVGLSHDQEGRLIRGAPAATYGVEGISGRLASAIGIAEPEAARWIESHLVAASNVTPDPTGEIGPFAFRLHQFFSPGLGIFSTAALPADRFLSLDGQRSDPSDADRPLFPMAFCRMCGQDYLTVSRLFDDDNVERLVPRRLYDTGKDPGITNGFLYIPDEGAQVDLLEFIPDDWLEEARGGLRVRRARQDLLPVQVSIDPSGRIGGSITAWLVPQPFSLCLNPDCRAAYTGREADITRLSVLGTQGRSTATTMLSISTLDFLDSCSQVTREAKKLLSFTDNRQDASLQAGHVNDFVEVGLLRTAIYQAALAAGDEGIPHDRIAMDVERSLKLRQEEYAAQPSTLTTRINSARSALRDVLGYRIYRDLSRGWRVNAPNLEQVGLLKIEYPDLPVICEEQERWVGRHPSLVGLDPETRALLCRELLERLRRKLAIRVDYLDPDWQDGLKRRSSQSLREPWAISDEESLKLQKATYGWREALPENHVTSDLSLTARSSLGNWLRTPSTWGGVRQEHSMKDTDQILGDLVDVLTEAGLLTLVPAGKDRTAYQLNAEVMVWKATEPSAQQLRFHNPFFERLYRGESSQLRGVEAREHTAQVSSEDREDRERRFRAGELPLLYCSPTMELGVDISDLNVVNMRNVPPTPANYAQRGGRAGRSGQPAFVFTYCTVGSPHDQYYFRRPDHMVAGAVAPPRLDLANEDLVRAHVHAIWLAETGLNLGSSLPDLLVDAFGEDPTLELRKEVLDEVQSPQVRDRTLRRGKAMLAALGKELEGALWYTDDWLANVVSQVRPSLDSSCDRWRSLYRSAREQARTQGAVLLDITATEQARNQANRLRDEAEAQLGLLGKAGSGSLSDFYVYRYLASEGFLPGYNFPRLPLTAYLPGRRQAGGYLSRARFLAITEFGPGAIVYHEGSRYVADRVMMGASARTESGGLVLAPATLCPACGYLHGGPDAQTVDLCDRCGVELHTTDTITSLFRLEGVNLYRRDRITCDEEERMRQGHELRTGIRFPRQSGEIQQVVAEVVDPQGAPVAQLTYCQSANIWRINVGWRKRKEQDQLGYRLDTATGRWVARDGEAQMLEPETGAVDGKVERVVPYVEDHRNALLLEFATPPNREEHAGLQAALKSAIQAVFQLEDSELAAEPLPSENDRRMILLYEASEGGAGVLRRLVDEPDALRKVARAALEACHFDPDTLEDRKRNPRAREDCSAACYDCLMSYSNQRDHRILDRNLIVDHLAALRDGQVSRGSGGEPRAVRLKKLLAQCGSDLERDWLGYLNDRKLSLPDHAQYRIEECGTVPDFAYVRGANRLAVYIDGPPHDYPARQERDKQQDEDLLDYGWLVIRFHHQADWDALLAQYPGIFGGEA